MENESIDELTTNDTPHEVPFIWQSIRALVPNQKYFGNDFLNMQISKTTSTKNLHTAPFPSLQHGINWFKSMGCTKLINQSLAGMIFTQMLAKVGLKKHGMLAKQAFLKEFTQLNDMEIMASLDSFNLSFEQKSTALVMGNLIKKKGTTLKSIQISKGQSCVNGRPRWPLYAKEERASPTVSLDAFILTLTIDAKEKHDVASADIVGAYLHTKMDELVIMQITSA